MKNDISFYLELGDELEGYAHVEGAISKDIFEGWMKEQHRTRKDIAQFLPYELAPYSHAVIERWISERNIITKR